MTPQFDTFRLATIHRFSLVFETQETRYGPIARLTNPAEQPANSPEMPLMTKGHA